MSPPVADHAERRPPAMRRSWPGWLRTLLSMAVVLLAFKLYAGWHWSRDIGEGPGVTFSPTQSYVGWRSAVTLATKHIYEQFPRGTSSILSWWRLSYVLALILPAALLSVAAYALLTHLRGPARAGPHPRCRRCDYLLRGLDRPQCPECGERI